MLILGGLVIEASLIIIVSVGNLSEQAGLYCLLFAGLLLVFGLSTWLVLRQVNAGAGLSGKLSRTGPSLAVILFFAIVFRLTALTGPPTLSTDLFRYTWEGKLVTLGISPYRYAPDAPQLEPYRSPLWSAVQQKETASPYPPLAQVVGAAGYLLVGESWLGPKLAAVLFDLLVCLALLWLLKLCRLDPRRLIFYAWCPLPVLEFGLSGHNDGPMLLGLLLALGFAVRRQPARSALFLGLACLAKFTPLLLLPLFWPAWHLAALKERGWRMLFWPATWRYPALTLLVIAAGYAPFLILGGGAAGSLLEYTGSWRDNDALFFRLAADTFGLLPAKLASLLVLALFTGWLAFQPLRSVELDLPRRMLLALGVTLMVASTVHAWYLTWLLVLLPLVWRRPRHFMAWDIGWLYLAFAVQLPYLTYQGQGQSDLYNWITPLEWWPLYLLSGWTGWRIWQTRARTLTMKGSFSDRAFNPAE